MSQVRKHLTNLSVTRFQHCYCCGSLKPLTSTFFDRNKRMPTGFLRKCKLCVKEYRKRYYQRNRERLKAYTKSYTEENREAKQAYDKRWREENKERKAATDAAYREQNRGRMASQQKAWREQNRERLVEYFQQYRKENKERIAQYNKQWREANPEHARLGPRRYFARLASAKGDHTPEDIRQMYGDQDGLCAYCEISLEGRYHVDHMQPISRGGRNDWINLAVVCPECNLSKHDKTTEEFFEHRWK